MDYLPKDPAILVSSVNMLLRDDSKRGVCGGAELRLSGYGL